LTAASLLIIFKHAWMFDDLLTGTWSRWRRSGQTWSGKDRHF